MGRWWSCLGAIAALLAALFGGGSGGTSTAYPTGCSTTSFTGSAGYYDQAHLYSLPEDTATLTVHWCYSNDVITSHTLSDTDSIPGVPAADPYIATSATPADNGSVLDVQLAGSFDTGIINNVGHFLITGDVTATGQRRFASDPGSGG